MEKVDRRVRRTHRLLSEALIALSLEKGYDAVSIRQITEQADVAYVTFFRHYRDKDELLAQTLEDVIREIEHLTLENGLLTESLHIFRHVQANSALYRVLMSNRGTHHVLREAKQKIIDHLYRYCAPLFASDAPVPPEVAAHHLAASLMNLIEWWVEHEMPYSPERMAEIYEHLAGNIL